MMWELWCAVPWCRQLVAGLLARRLVFDPARVTWDLWTPWHWHMFLYEYFDFTLSVWFHPVSMISPMFRIYLYLNTSLTRRTSGRNKGTFKRSYGRYSSKTSKCTKCVQLYTPYTSYVFRPLMWPSSARDITKEGCIEVLQKFWTNAQI